MQNFSILMAALVLSASGAYAGSPAFMPGSADVAADSQGAVDQSNPRHAHFNKWQKKTANFKPLYQLPNQSGNSEAALKAVPNSIAAIGAPTIAAQEQNQTRWVPKKQTVYLWARESWFTYYEYTFEYNDKGQVATLLSDIFTGQKIRATTEWNENDKPVLITSEVAYEGGDFENYQQNQYAYDTKVTNFYTLYQVASWDRSAWWPGDDSYKNFITRNEAETLSL